jgi:hypothetical protein
MMMCSEEDLLDRKGGKTTGQLEVGRVREIRHDENRIRRPEMGYRFLTRSEVQTTVLARG